MCHLCVCRISLGLFFGREGGGATNQLTFFFIALFISCAQAAVNEKGELLPGPVAGEPIGWGGATLFNFDQVLRTGHMRIKLFPGKCTPELAGVATLLSNSTKKDVDILDVEIPRFPKPIIYQDNVQVRERPAPGMRFFYPFPNA